MIKDNLCYKKIKNWKKEWQILYFSWLKFVYRNNDTNLGFVIFFKIILFYNLKKLWIQLYMNQREIYDYIKHIIFIWLNKKDVFL